MRTRTVTSTEVRLHVVEDGPTDAETVVFVHGFPDTHETWLPVMERISHDLHVVAYDVRGFGASSAPAAKSGYRIDRLGDDLVAVLDEVRPDGAPVHLVGHDWGSVQLWGILSNDDPRLRGRVASFTSISGPPLEAYVDFLLGTFKGPDRKGSRNQLAHAWYVAFFQIPGLPEFVFSRAGDKLGKTISKAEGVPDLFGPTLPRDGRNGVNLYRVNTRKPRPAKPLGLPTQLIVPTRDPYVGVALNDAIAEQVQPQRRVDLDASHWVIRADPSRIAAEIREFIDEVNL